MAVSPSFKRKHETFVGWCREVLKEKKLQWGGEAGQKWPFSLSPLPAGAPVLPVATTTLAHRSSGPSLSGFL